MNAATIQKLLIQSGFVFAKIPQENNDQLVWACMDSDQIPIVSGKVLSEVIWKMNAEIGGVA